MDMVIINLNIRSFRNISDEKLDFSNQFNVFLGNNGHGKTNILEAIFFLGTIKSFRHATIKEMINWNQPASSLNCNIVNNGLRHTLQVHFDTYGKQLKVDGKNIHKAIEYCSYLSVVAFSPDEMRMVDGTPELRRRFLDRAIFSCNSDYLRIYHDYFRVLKQRNQLLRHRNYAGLDAWTEQLVTKGARLVSVRNRFVTELAERFPEYYRDISGSDEEGRLCYHANSLHDLRDETEIMDHLYAALSESSRLERERGVTLKGPHRDDLDFILNGKPIREHGSQGQQKSFVIALKMAEIENAKRKTGNPPVLLLDDVTSELDGTRSLHLLNFLTERNIQVFITATDLNMVPFTKEQDISCFYVENGRIVQKGN